MAVAPTGNIFKALSFDNVSSRTYGVYITGEAVYNAPGRDVEMVEIPGRNGSFALDKGRFQNIEVSYPAGIFADNETDFAEAISDFRNFLCSRRGYVRLSDEYNPNEYRMAIYKSGLEVTPAQLKAGEFNIVFDCKPQRWLTSGETAVTIGEWGETETASGDVVSVENPNGVLAVKSLVADIVPIQSGSGDPSPSNVRPISGHTDVVVSRTGKNLCDTSTAEIGTAWNGASNSARARLVIPLVVGQTYTLKANGTSTLDSWYGIETDTIPPSSPGAVLSNPYTFTATTKYLSLGFNKTAIASTDIEALKLQLELGSMATTYEAYQGDTYTTALGRTVYGGTLDVTTGVLTVTHEIITFNGASAEQWEYYSVAQGNLFRHSQSDRESGPLINKEVYCNRFEVVDNTNKTNGTLSSPNSGGEKYFDFIYDDCNSVATWKTWLSSNNVQVVYPLATPTTTTLTAQQISTLLGDNNIWSSGGTITLEYGQNPSVLFNPTLFESSPMLEVEGYGNINLNGAEIELSNEVMGDVVFWNSYNRELITNRLSWSLVGQNGILNNGDTITINGFEYSGYQTVQSTPPIDIALVSSSHSGITGVNIDFWYEYTSSERKGARVGYTATFPILNFTYGTPSTLTDTEEVNYTLTSGEAVFPHTIHYQTTLAYDGDRTIAVSIERESSATGFYYMRASMPQAIGASTVSILGHPTYIDTDMGNAYKIESNDYISLNRYIDLGSDLPVLGAGSNEITYDNTITDLKVIPRWWKV